MDPIRFQIRDFNASGVWDGESRLLLLEGVGGELTATVKIMGANVDLRGSIDAAMDNRLRIRISTIGKLPAWINPYIFKLIKSFGGKLRDVLEFDADTISLDPNMLISKDDETRILIQPQTLELTPGAERSIRQRVIGWAQTNGGKMAAEIAEIVMVIPDSIVLLIRLAGDKRVPAILKWKIGLAVAYAISPLDLIPDVMAGPLGLVDDALAMVLIILKLGSEIPADLIKENWPGNPEIIDGILTGKPLAALAGLLPEKVRRTIYRVFGEENSEAAAAFEEKR